MTKDIVPDLLAQIEAAFRAQVSESEVLQSTLARLVAGQATYETAGAQASELGRILSEALQTHLSGDVLPDGRMYYNIASRILQPTLEQNHDLVAGFATEVQQQLNKAAGLGLKAQTPKLNQDRIDGLVQKVSEAEKFDDVKWVLDEPIQNFSRSVVDDTVRLNAEFQHKVGLSPKIIRSTNGKCCDWCSRLAGEYSYPDVPKDVYRRHRYCDCVVEYIPAKGKRQNVHTKKESGSKADRDMRVQQEKRWLEQEATNREKRKEERRLYELNTNKPSRRELVERYSNAIYDPNNQGIIAERILNGEYSMNLKKQKYLQHKEGTPQYQRALEARGKPQSILTISDVECQKLIHEKAGTGVARKSSSGKVLAVEFVNADQVIGKYPGAYGNMVETHRASIHYSKRGAHVVPVKEIKDD